MRLTLSSSSLSLLTSTSCLFSCFTRLRHSSSLRVSGEGGGGGGAQTVLIPYPRSQALHRVSLHGAFVLGTELRTSYQLTYHRNLASTSHSFMAGARMVPGCRSYSSTLLDSVPAHNQVLSTFASVHSISHKIIVRSNIYHLNTHTSV